MPIFNWNGHVFVVQFRHTRRLGRAKNISGMTTCVLRDLGEVRQQPDSFQRITHAFCSTDSTWNRRIGRHVSMQKALEGKRYEGIRGHIMGAYVEQCDADRPAKQPKVRTVITPERRQELIAAGELTRIRRAQSRAVARWDMDHPPAHPFPGPREIVFRESVDVNTDKLKFSCGHTVIVFAGLPDGKGTPCVECVHAWMDEHKVREQQRTDAARKLTQEVVSDYFGI